MEDLLSRIARLSGILAASWVFLLLFTALAIDSAQAKQPYSVSQLVGTWFNIKASGTVAQVVIMGTNGGDFEVHPFAFCSPSNCDWGTNSAFRFSSSIVSTSAIGFHVIISVDSSTVYMQGHLVTGPQGQKWLEITTQQQFATSDPRKPFEVTEDFQLQ
jgi:hypothetical protein